MYNLISLFTGAMGLDIGLELAGFKTNVCVEIDKYFSDTIRTNKPNMTVLGDITELTTKQILKSANLTIGKVDLIAGGPPCQSFSTAGKRLSVADPRGSLINNFIRVVREAKPRFFVMENVKGLRSAAIRHRPLNDRDSSTLSDEEQLGSAFKEILRDFQTLGYTVIWDVLDAVDYGIPQFRERLFIIGSRDHEDIFIPHSTHFMKHQNPEYRWRTLESAILDLESDPGPCAKFSKEREDYLKFIKPGENWRALPPRLIKKAMGGAYESGGGKMGFFRRLNYKEPSPTLVTSPAQKATMLCHPVSTRPLSVSEYARIQQFPDRWTLSGPLLKQYMQIGNAVPVGLGQAIGEMLDSVIRSNAIVKTKRYRGTHKHKQPKVNL
jgi:DNA (cytosine-5)-methyltransferase 1